MLQNSLKDLHFPQIYKVVFQFGLMRKTIVRFAVSFLIKGLI
jgi:hypothetical protein